MGGEYQPCVRPECPQPSSRLRAGLLAASLPPTFPSPCLGGEQEQVNPVTFNQGLVYTDGD